MEKIEAICYKAVIQKGKWKHLNDVVVRPMPNLFWSEVDSMIEGYNLGKSETLGVASETENTKDPVAPEDYEYEMFFNSEPSEPCQIHGWYPVATDRIRNPEKIEEYIQKGLLRRK